MSRSDLALLLIVCIFCIYMTYDLINLIVTCLFSKKFGEHIKYVLILGFMIEKCDGKWQASKGKKSFGIRIMTARDLQADRLRDSEKDSKNWSILNSVLNLVICAGISVAVWKLALTGIDIKETSFLEKCLIFYVIGLIVRALLGIVVVVFVLNAATNGLTGYCETIRKKLVKGYMYEELEMKSIDELNFDKPSRFSLGIYYTYYFNYLYSVGRIDELKDVVTNLGATLNPDKFNLYDTPKYYSLIYYYSYYDPCVEMAEYYYNVVSKILEKDNDANGKRVLAYYHFGITHNYEMALKCVDEGIAAIDKFSVEAEKSIEKKMLNELKDVIIDNDYS